MEFIILIVAFLVGMGCGFLLPRPVKIIENIHYKELTGPDDKIVAHQVIGRPEQRIVNFQFASGQSKLKTYLAHGFKTILAFEGKRFEYAYTNDDRVLHYKEIQ